MAAYEEDLESIVRPKRTNLNKVMLPPTDALPNNGSKTYNWTGTVAVLHVIVQNVIPSKANVIYIFSAARSGKGHGFY